MIKLICDRCGREHDRPTLIALPSGNPFANRNAPDYQTYYGEVRLPDGWRKVTGSNVTGSNLCVGCVAELDFFLQPKPVAVNG